jgi:hypothetical protein
VLSSEAACLPGQNAGTERKEVYDLTVNGDSRVIPSRRVEDIKHRFSGGGQICVPTAVNVSFDMARDGEKERVMVVSVERKPKRGF